MTDYIKIAEKCGAYVKRESGSIVFMFNATELEQFAARILADARAMITHITRDAA